MLVISQVAVSVVLLTAAGLLLTSFYRLQKVNAGYNPERVLSAEVYGNFTRYTTAEDSLRLYQPLLEQLQATARRAIGGDRQPGAAGHGVRPVSRPVRDRRPIRGRARAAVRRHGHRQRRLLPHAGHSDRRRPRVPFDRYPRVDACRDHQSEHGALLGRQPIRSAAGSGSTARRGTRSSAWPETSGSTGSNREAIAQAYVPMMQTPSSFAGSVLVRTTGDPTALATAVRDAVHSLDPRSAGREHQDARGVFAAASWPLRASRPFS